MSFDDDDDFNQFDGIGQRDSMIYGSDNNDDYRFSDSDEDDDDDEDDEFGKFDDGTKAAVPPTNTRHCLEGERPAVWWKMPKGFRKNKRETYETFGSVDLEDQIEGITAQKIPGEFIMATMLNKTNRRVEIFWLDFKGTQISYGQKDPGEIYSCKTYIHHPWIVRAVPTEEGGDQPLMLLEVDGGKSPVWIPDEEDAGESVEISIVESKPEKTEEEEEEEIEPVFLEVNVVNNFEENRSFIPLIEWNNLKSNQENIVSLDLSGLEQLTDCVFGIFKYEVHLMANLKYINCNGCRYITDTGVHFLAQSCPKLVEIELLACYKLTQTCLLSLKKYCNQLTTVAMESGNIIGSPPEVETLGYFGGLSAHEKNTAPASFNEINVVVLVDSSTSEQMYNHLQLNLEDRVAATTQWTNGSNIFNILCQNYEVLDPTMFLTEASIVMIPYLDSMMDAEPLLQIVLHSFPLSGIILLNLAANNDEPIMDDIKISEFLLKNLERAENDFRTKTQDDDRDETFNYFWKLQILGFLLRRMMSFSDDSVAPVTERVKHVEAMPAPSPESAKFIENLLDEVFTTLKGYGLKYLSNLDADTIQYVDNVTHQLNNEVVVSFGDRRIANKIIHNCGRFVDTFDKETSEVVPISRERLITVVNKLASQQQLRINAETIFNDLEMSSQVQSSVLCFLENKNILITETSCDYLNNLIKVNTVSDSCTDEENESKYSSLTIIYDTDDYTKLNENLHFKTICKAISVLAYPAKLYFSKAFYQIGCFDIVFSLNDGKLSLKVVSYHPEDLSLMMINSILAFKIIIDFYLHQNGIIYSYQYQKILQGVSEIPDIEEISSISGTPYYEFTQVPWEKKVFPKHSAFNGFPTISVATSAALWHMYCQINPQFLSLHGSLKYNSSILGSKNFITDTHYDGYFLPLSPLNPVYNSSVRISFPYKLGSTMFYIGGEYKGIFIDLNNGNVTSAQGSNIRETVGSLYDDNSNHPIMNQVTLEVNIFPKLNCSEDKQEICVLTLSTPYKIPLTLEIPWGVYHIGTYVQNPKLESHLTYFLEIDSIPSPSLLARYDGILKENCAWREGMRLEALDKATGGIICVATVTRVKEHFNSGNPRIQIKIHFDGWSTKYDYDTDIFDSELHPLGYTKKQDKILQTAKCYCKDEDEQVLFSWDQYLNDIAGNCVPSYLFHGDQKGKGFDDVFYFKNVKNEKHPYYFGQLLEVTTDSDFQLQAAMAVERPEIYESSTKVRILLLQNLNRGPHGKIGNMAGPTVQLYDVNSIKLHPVGYHEYLLSSDPLYAEKHLPFIFIDDTYTKNLSAYRKRWIKFMTDYNMQPVDHSSFTDMQKVGCTDFMKTETENQDNLEDAEFDSSLITSPYLLRRCLDKIMMEKLVKLKLIKFVSLLRCPPAILFPTNISLRSFFHPTSTDIYSWEDQKINFLCTAFDNYHLNFDKGSPHNFDIESCSQFFAVSIILLLISSDNSPKVIIPSEIFEESDETPNVNYLEKDYKLALSKIASIYLSFFLFLNNHSTLFSNIESIEEDEKTRLFQSITPWLYELWDNNKSNDGLWFKKFMPGTEAKTNYVCNGHAKCIQNDSDLDKIPEEVKNLTHIEEIQFSHNKIIIVDYIWDGLMRIDLSYNKIELLPEDIKICTRLKFLDVSYNRIKNIPEGLITCRNLTSLSISGNPVQNLPDNFGDLQNLTDFAANNTLLYELPKSCKNLKSLSKITLNENQTINMNDVICDLNLDSLQIAGLPWISLKNKTDSITFKEVEKFLENYHVYMQKEFIKWRETFDMYDVKQQGFLDKNGLQKFNANLIMFEHPMYTIPKPLFKIKTLKTLNLSRQCLKEITDDIIELVNLQHLDVSYNPQLESLSSNIGELPLKKLILDGCFAIKTPPIEIVKKGFYAIIGYMKRLLTGSVTCKRTKLMLIGLGGAGKTSLLQSLQNSGTSESFDATDTEVTDGINISTWYIPDKDLTFSAWDFAGQSVYYNTHQFFLTNRAIYLLLWNMRLGFEHAGLQFWLSSVSCHAPNAPIFVIGTHSDQISRFTLPVDTLKKRFPQIVDFYNVSSYTNDGIDQLRSDIIECALQEWYMGEKIPKVWLNFEKSLVEKQRLDHLDYVSWDDFSTLGYNQGVVEDSELLEVCQFLHELGSVQHFETETLKDKVVINPQWIVDVMKCVVSINDSAIKDGKFFHEDIGSIWDEYPKDLHEWLLHLTEEFDLTFLVSKSEEKPYNLVPCLLPEPQPIFVWPIPDIEGGIFESRYLYKFSFIPAGLFNRAQVRLSQYSDSFVMWKKGSMLIKNEQKCLVTVEDGSGVLVKANGNHPKNIIYLVHEVIDGIISESFHGLSYDLMIPCNDCVQSGSRDPALFAASEIKRALNLKVPMLQCRQSFHSIPLVQIQTELPTDSRDFSQLRVQLENGVKEMEQVSREMQKQVFFLYSEKDQTDPEVVSPRKIMNDVENESGLIGCDRAVQDSEEDLVVKIKTSGNVVVCMSKNFIDDKRNADLLLYIHSILKKEMQVIVIDDRSNWSKTTAGSLFAGELYVSFTDANLYEAKITELIALLEKRKTEKEFSAFPPCFISYCWSNSLEAVKHNNMTLNESAVGWMDPRRLKSELEDRGVNCWMDIEQVGGAGGLFEDIAEGLRRAKVVVACVSEEYTRSRNCQMEFRFASTSLRLPIIVVVVGKKDAWRKSEVGMLALSYPELNMQYESPAVVDQLHERVEKILRESAQAGQSIAAQKKPKTNQTVAYQEMIELNQRKLLHQLAEFAQPVEKDAYPFPRIFTLDLLHEEEENTEEKLLEKEEEKVEDAEDKSEKTKPKATFKNLGIRFLCEHEKGWHPVSMTLPLQAKNQTDQFFQEVSVYEAMILKLMKCLKISLDVYKENHLVSQLEALASAAGDFETHLQKSYLALHQAAMAADVMKRFGGLKRCQLASGHVCWLCESHIKMSPNVSVLSSKAQTKAAFSEGEFDDMALLTEELAKLRGKKQLSTKLRTVAKVFAKGKKLKK